MTPTPEIEIALQCYIAEVVEKMSRARNERDLRITNGSML
jgi:hypothetical protein